MDLDNSIASPDEEVVKKPVTAPITFTKDIAVLKLSSPIEVTVKNEAGDDVKETLHTIKIKPVTMKIFPIFMTGSTLKMCSFLTDISTADLGELLPQDASLLLNHVNNVMQPIIGIIDSKKVKLDLSKITDNLTYDVFKLPVKIETDTGFVDEIRINKAKFKHYDMWESKARNLVFVVEKLTGISRYFLERLKPDIGAILYRHVNDQVKLFLQTPCF